MGIALRGAGELDAAREQIAQAIALDPKQPGAHYQLALTLKTLDDLAGAERALNQALALHPDMVEARRELDMLPGNRGVAAVAGPPLGITGNASPVRDGDAAADRLNRYIQSFIDGQEHPRIMNRGITQRNRGLS